MLRNHILILLVEHNMLGDNDANILVFLLNDLQESIVIHTQQTIIKEWHRHELIPEPQKNR